VKVSQILGPFPSIYAAPSDLETQKK